MIMSPPLASEPTSWIPDPDITDHAGQPISENSNFFAMPPIEIGRVISAETTLIKRHKFSSDRVIKLVLVAVAIPLGIGLAPIALPILFIALFLKIHDYVIWSLNRQYRSRHFCTYAGEHGLAIYSLRKGLWSRPKCKLVLFQDQVALYTSATSVKINGIYRNTQYHFIWKNSQQKKYQVMGAFHKDEKRKSDYMWHFATAAEIAWSRYLQSQLPQHLERNGYVEFPIVNLIGKFTAIRVGVEFVEFVGRKGKAQRFLASEIDSIQYYYGRLEFFPHGVKRFSRLVGKYNFSNKSIGNIRFLVASLKALTKIPFA